jgi:hypothetical protein
MDAPLTPESNGRLRDGRFGAGNRFGQGNPQHRKMAELRAAMLEAVEPEQVKGLTRKLCELALAGDVPAARLVMEYALGKPVQAVELTGAAGEPRGLDWAGVQAAILEALAPFGEARVAVALKLRSLTDDARDAPG